MTKKRSKKAPKHRVQHKPSPPKAARTETAETAEAAAPKAQRKPGIKAQISALFLAGGEYTLEKLLEATGAKEVTLRTAIYDLRSTKYAGPTGALNITLTDGKYKLEANSGQ